MTTPIRQTNPSLIAWMRAAVVAASVFTGLTAAGAAPRSLPVAIAVVAGVLAYLVDDLGVLAAVVALSLPVLATAPVLGIGMLVVGIAGVRYLGADGARSYMVVAAAFAGVVFGPAWAAVALAGVFLGAGEGALAAAVACVAIEVLGISLGRESIGLVMSGGHAPLLELARMPETLFDTAWVADSLRTLDARAVDDTIASFTGVTAPLALVVQPAVWAGGAAIAGAIAREARSRRSLPILLAGAAAGATVTALGTVVASTALDLGIASGDALATLAVSAVVAVAFVFVYERFFVTERRPVVVPEAAVGLGAEDADVDELLTLIATAEERLATEHTTHRAVMITDMKSFSTMTEEDGSIVTAKAIQRHRDLLLPIVERHGGQGKSTGGDGLIAAFPTAADALLAAVEMQRALAAHNAAHPSERELAVRIGVAEGEVVLDKRGRPFIGAAINLAARIMNLADGGQAFSAASTAKGGPVTTRPLGVFELKNIAEPVEVVELTWAGNAVGAAKAG